MKITFSTIYRCTPDEEAERILNEFPKMVNWWLIKAENVFKEKERKPLRYAEFRNMFYHEWRKEFSEWSCHYAHTSSLVAFTETNRCSADQFGKRIKAENRFAVIHPCMVWMDKEILKITTSPKKYAYVELEPKNKWEEILLRQVEKKAWRIGQVLLRENWAFIPLLRNIGLSEKEDPVLTELLEFI